MCLVRSVTAERLSERGIQTTLLEHFSRPAVENEEDPAGLVKLCESGFEGEVFGLLVQRGYPRRASGMKGVVRTLLASGKPAARKVRLSEFPDTYTGERDVYRLRRTAEPALAQSDWQSVWRRSRQQSTQGQVSPESLTLTTLGYGAGAAQSAKLAPCFQWNISQSGYRFATHASKVGWSKG